MPTYQYKCRQCDHRLEAVQSFTDAPLTECPSCGGDLRKVFSSVGVVFKGSGFYRTDSRAAASANGDKDSTAAKADGKTSGDKAKSEGTSGAKAAPSERRPAAKAEPSTTTKSA